jgi:integrase
MLSKMFSLASRYGITDKNPAPGFTAAGEQQTCALLVSDEEQRLLSVLTEPRRHLLPLVVLSIGTGMRRGDLFNLTWERIDF